MKSNDDINILVENFTLRMFHVGSNNLNYKILKMLPTDVHSIMKSVNLTKVPVNTRLNSLKEVGLVKRKKGTGMVVQSEYTHDFLELLDCIKSQISESVKSQLSAIH